MSEATHNKLPAPLATVVIPCYNYAEMVTRAIKSVQAQTFSNLECFIVDDGSTDSSKLVIQDAIKNDARFHYIYQENRGVAIARNRGVYAGSAPYVCCLDADDEIAPQFLEACILELEKNPSLGIAYTGLWAIEPDGKEGLSPWPGEYNYDQQLTNMNQIPTCNVARRTVWERLGGQRQRYAPEGAGEEDAEMWLRVGAYGFNAIKATTAGLFRYRWKSGRVSGSTTHKMVDYRAWHPWTKDLKHPFASMAQPKRPSHSVRQYDEPTISIIIPVGPGHETKVVEALDSIEAQTLRNVEIIVVGDGVMPYFEWDDDVRMANQYVTNRFKNFEKAYPYVHYINLIDGPHGAGLARNRGVEASRAPFLFFLDADDSLHSEGYPDALEEMLDNYQVDNGIVYADYIGKAHMDEASAVRYGERLLHYDAKNSIAVVSYHSANYDYDKAIIQPKPDKNGQMFIWCQISSLVPRAFHDEIGGFDETMQSWEDWDYWLRFAKAGKCFTRVRKPFLIYRFYTGGRREVGLQEHPNLIQYLKEKYKDIENMDCGCKKDRPTNYVNRSPVPRAVTQTARADGRSIDLMDDKNMVLCLYNNPNRGGHKVVGAVTGITYGYFGGGKRHLIHKDDIAGRPDLFVPVEQQQVVPPPPPKPTPPPVPVQETKASEPIVEESVDPFEMVYDEPLIPETVAVPEPVEAPVEEKEERPFDLQTLPGITPIIAQEMNAAGIHTLEDIMHYSSEDLQKIKYIGKSRADGLLKYAAERTLE